MANEGIPETPEQIISLNQWELQDEQGAIFISKLVVAIDLLCQASDRMR